MRSNSANDSTSGIISLIQPLYFVALMDLNEMKLRCFAIEQLRRIALETGVLQAALLAGTAAEAIRGQGHIQSAMESANF